MRLADCQTPAMSMRHVQTLRSLASRLQGAGQPPRTLPAVGASSASAAARWFGASRGVAAAMPSRQQRQRQRGAAASASAQEAVEDEGLAADSRIIETELRQEAERSYLAYAMSVIVGRALPDVRDGLKPVHRRIMFAMHELGLASSKPHRKCARVVGEVLGKFHPHGDTAVYDALVRLAQPFSMRLQLVDGHGNFGSQDDDPPAAMRYTECRLQAAASAMLLADLEASTVDFAPNFDASVEEPTVLPARLPNLLINGSSGIAVGIATKIPPHNMGEVVAGLKALIRNPNITVRQLMQHIPGPDFPTGGEILLTDGVRAAYEEGRGGVLMRAKMHIEDPNSAAAAKRGKGKGGRQERQLVVVTELPYQTNKSALVEQIARLVDAGTLTGVSDVRDESDRDGLRVVVEVKRGGSADLVLNQLVKHTAVQGRFSCNMVALVGATPKTLTLKDFLRHWLDFRCDVIERRGRHELLKAQTRLHLVDGYLAAMRDLDAVVHTIRQATDAAAASAALQSEPFGLSKEQAEGVLGMTLRRLTGLEAGKLREEQAVLNTKIADISDLLQKRDRILQVVEQEADELVAKHGTPRRTAIVADGEVELRPEDVTPNAHSLVVYSRRGYIKRMRADTFERQRLGGTGKAGARLKEDDALDDCVGVNDHDHLLFFTSEGRAYSLRAYDVPEGSRTSQGSAVAQVLPIPKGTRVAAMVPVADFGAAPRGSAPPPGSERDVVMLTRKGLIKRTPLAQFASINRSGLTAIKVKEGDSLQFVGLCAPTDSVFIAASHGRAQHFPIGFVSRMGRTAAGNLSMKLTAGAEIVAMAILPAGIAPEGASDTEEEDEEEGGSSSGAGAGASASGGSVGGGEEADEAAAAGEESEQEVETPSLLLVTRQGRGKLTPISSFPLKASRRGLGIIACKLNPGDRLAAVQVVGVSGGGSSSSGGGGGESGSEDEAAGRRPTDALLSTEKGLLVRVPIARISSSSRSAKGQRVIKVREGDEVVAATVMGR